MSWAERRFRRDRETGFIKVALQTPRGRKWISTGERTIRRAHEVCDQAMIDKLQMAANAGVLNDDAVSLLRVGRRFGCMDVFEAWKEERSIDLSDETMASYEQIVLQFISGEDCRNKPVHAIGRRALDQFVNGQGIALATRRVRLAAVRSYFGFASAAGYTVGNLAMRVFVRKRDLLFVQAEAKEVLPITAEEYARIMASPKVGGFWRWATALSYWLGLRISDVACLEWASIQPDHIVVHTRKRGGRVAFHLDDPLFGGGELRRIVAEMREHGEQDEVFCFPKEREKMLDTTKRAQLSWGYIRVLHRCDIKGKSFHGLRHALATRLAAAGKTLKEIGHAMAHSDEETTAGYIHG